MADNKEVSDSNPNETGYYPGGDSWSRWRNIFGILSGHMTDEGKQQYKLAKDIQNEAADVKRCEKYRDYLFKYSPTIRFMRENIQQVQGDINETNVRCRRCTKPQSGGFDPDYGIMICANEMRDQGHFEDTLAHEMIHAYDHLRFKVKWKDDLRHAACAEVPFLLLYESLGASADIGRRSELQVSVGNAGGLENSSAGANEPLPSSIKNVSDGGLLFRSWVVLLVKTMLMR
ncbi:MAG: Mitochondrial inner membrane protease atp23 [Candelina mexicana]|nr:MAG: Mitochondrial inner membrane protease atp23 [Candelina mexicana]